MSKETVTENKMAVMPVNKLMLSMGFPMIVSMMLQAVYNIVDSAFVANMQENGEMALNALTLAFPVQMLMVAIGIGTGVGVNALLAKNLGMGDQKRASKAAGNGLFLMILIYGVLLLFGLFGVDAYIQSQTKNPLVAQMAVGYLRICCIWSMGILLFSLYEKVLQATGNSLYSTIAQIAGALVNIILDPIMIYGWFGVPKMGVEGAAWATVIGQMVSAALGIFFHWKVNRELENGLSYIKPDAGVIKGIYAIGLPAMIAQALMSIMTYLLNIIFGGIGENVVTAYGLYYKIQQFILFAAFGLRDAITPIVSYNYGRNAKDRVQEGIRVGLKYTLFIMLAGFLLLEVFASPFAGIFGLSGDTKNLCISAIRVISFSYVFAGANIAYQGVFQALDGGMESLVVSLCRQFLFVIPTARIFRCVIISGWGSSWLVWLTFPIAEILAAFVSVGFMKKLRKRIFS